MTRAFDEDMPHGFGTQAVHAGQRPEPLAGAIMTPVYLTSTYVQEGLGQNKGYEYARGKNPTREAFERNVAALENGRHGLSRLDHEAVQGRRPRRVRGERLRRHVPALRQDPPEFRSDVYIRRYA